MAVHTKELSRQSQQTELEQVDKSRSTTAPSQDTREEEEVVTKATSPDHTFGINAANVEGRMDAPQSSPGSVRTSLLNGEQPNDVTKALCGMGSQFESCADKSAPSGYPRDIHESPAVYADGLVEPWLSESSEFIGRYPSALPITFDSTASNSGSSVDLLAGTASRKKDGTHAYNGGCCADIVAPASNALDADAAAALLGPHYGKSSFRRSCDGGYRGHDAREALMETLSLKSAEAQRAGNNSLI